MENILQELFSGNFARALCLTLLHSLWQAALMALMAMLLMSVTRKAVMAVWRVDHWRFGYILYRAGGYTAAGKYPGTNCSWFAGIARPRCSLLPLYIARMGRYFYYKTISIIYFR
jgi:hypothetical protein